MKRRSFLSLLGLAPAAPAIAKALQAAKPSGPVGSQGISGCGADGHPLLKGGHGKWGPASARRRLGARLRYADGRCSERVPCEVAVEGGIAYNINRIVFAYVCKPVRIDRVEIFDMASGTTMMYDRFDHPVTLCSGTQASIEPGGFRGRLMP